MKHFKISVLAISALLSAGFAAKAEDNNPAALAKALKGATITLDQGIKASEPQGTPISGKFKVLIDGKPAIFENGSGGVYDAHCTGGTMPLVRILAEGLDAELVTVDGKMETIPGVRCTVRNLRD